MHVESTMYLEVLYRIRAAPIAHLGCRSLVRLDAFHSGYSFFPHVKGTTEYSFEGFRDWVLAYHCPDGSAAKDSTQILLEVAKDDERAFDLFFSDLDAAISAYPDRLKVLPPRNLEGEPLAASGYLDVLTERPAMFLRRVSVGCLRAFLDGYSLAAVDELRFECADLVGFEQWVGRHCGSRGLSRWENAVLEQFRGDESAAFQWAVRELKAYRATKGPPSSRRYVVEHVVEDDAGT